MADLIYSICEMTVLREVSPSSVSAHGTNMEKKEVILALDLASRWNFHGARNQCITLLEKKSIAPAEKLALAQRFDIVAWLEPAVRRLVLRDEPLSVDEAKEIGIEMVTQIAILREKRLSKLLRTAQRATGLVTGAAKAEVESEICKDIERWIRKSDSASDNDFVFDLQEDIEITTTTTAASSPQPQSEDAERIGESASEAAVVVQEHVPDLDTLDRERIRAEQEEDNKRAVFKAAAAKVVLCKKEKATHTKNFRAAQAAARQWVKAERKMELSNEAYEAALRN